MYTYIYIYLQASHEKMEGISWIFPVTSNKKVEKAEQNSKLHPSSLMRSNKAHETNQPEHCTAVGGSEIRVQDFFHQQYVCPIVLVAMK